MDTIIPVAMLQRGFASGDAVLVQIDPQPQERHVIS